MKLSKETISVLKTFATINSNLLITEGSNISTVNVQKNVFAEANVTEEFPQRFGIYDTNEFLGVMSLFSDPDIEFKEKYAVLKEPGSSIKYYAADESVLTVPSKKMKFPPADITFALSAEALGRISKAAAVIRANDISIVGDGSKLTVTVGDSKISTSNSFTIEIGETDSTFTANIKIENLKLMQQDYEVSISRKNIVRFSANDGNFVVYVALEATSSFQ